MFLQSLDASLGGWGWYLQEAGRGPGARWTAPAFRPRSEDGTAENGRWVKEQTRT